MTELFFKMMHSGPVNRLSKIDSTFGIILRKKRLSKKLTQEALSIESSLSRAYISELERKHLPRGYDFTKIKANIRGG